MGEGKENVDEIAREAARIEEGLTYYEHTHRLSAQFWNRVHVAVGLGATAAAGASAVLQGTAGTDAVTISLAAAAATLSGATAFLSPRERAEEHRRGEREANRMRMALRRFRRLDLPIRFGSDSVAALDALQRLATERDRVLANLPEASQRKFDRARQDIAKGLFHYDADEREADE